jgi:hypothetical protein
MSEQNDRPTLAHISWIVWGFIVWCVPGLGFIAGMVRPSGPRGERALLGPMMTNSRTRTRTLQAQLTYVQSEPYVEEWAGVSARMAQENETLVVFIVSTPTPTATFVPTPTLTQPLSPFIKSGGKLFWAVILWRLERYCHCSDAAREAGALIKDHFGKVHQVTFKGLSIGHGSGSGLRSADCRHLKAAFPTMPFWQRKWAVRMEYAGRAWIIDPWMDKNILP